MILAESLLLNSDSAYYSQGISWNPESVPFFEISSTFYFILWFLIGFTTILSLESKAKMLRGTTILVYTPPCQGWARDGTKWRDVPYRPVFSRDGTGQAYCFQKFVPWNRPVFLNFVSLFSLKRFTTRTCVPSFTNMWAQVWLEQRLHTLKKANGCNQEKWSNRSTCNLIL